jgi:transmembrane sensor
MSDKKKPFNESYPDYGDNELNDIWKTTESFQPDYMSDPDEIEEGLKKVHSRIQAETNIPKKHREYIWLNARYLVAAIALIIFGAYYIFTPVSITVSYGEMATLELPDGSTAELNSGTTISYNRFYGRTHRELTLNGEAYFSVVNDENPFKVRANGTMTEVKGTRFNIRSWSDDPYSETTITVTEGIVSFYPVQSEISGIDITPGNQSRWNIEMTSPSTPDPVTVSDITGWREQRLIFRDQPLGTILRELERRFDTKIDLEVAGAELEPLTAYYAQPGNLYAVLEDITMVKGLRYSATANGYRIFK